MYGLPKDFDGACFLGKTVDSISFYAYSLYVSFEGGNSSLRIESSFEHRVGTEPDSQDCVQRMPVTHSCLMQLVGKMVESVNPQEDGTLTLHFDDGQLLRCFDDLPQYESYHISNGGTEIHV